MGIDHRFFQENERLSPQTEGREHCLLGRFECESGAYLPTATVAYQTWGEPAPQKDNAVLICHALSGDANAAGWWERLVGPGRAIDTNRYFVIGTNVLGGCQGSTGPSSPSPRDGRPYGSRFPQVTVGDMAEAMVAAVRHLGFDALLGTAGGSMGGMLAIEVARRFPVRAVWATASCAAHNAMQIGFNEAARQAVMRDPRWRSGDYPLDDPPADGLSVARMIGHLSYLSEASFERKFGRRRRADGVFEVESYLSHQGDKFNCRFDANSLLVLSRAIDGYECTTLADTPHPTQFLFTSFVSDTLYPSYQSRQLLQMARRSGRRAEWHEIDLPFGHDSFLLDGEGQAKHAGELFARF